jgi:hypothetical protein
MGNSPVFAPLLKMVPFCFPVAGNAVHAVASSHACQCQPIVRKSIGMIAEYLVALRGQSKQIQVMHLYPAFSYCNHNQ